MQAHSEHRIIQHNWRVQDNQGRVLVCALAAFGPDINSAKHCPADLMPQWVAELIPAIDDGIAANQVQWFSGELITRARKWHVLDDAAWERIRTGFMIAGIKQAIAAASKAQPDPVPEYWQQVTTACNNVIEALQSGKDLAAARAAAWAAETAAAWKEIAVTLFALIDAELPAENVDA
ncbi:hypothetical protein ADT71_06720 [Novosphingobium sp. ST904]|nr:hypothetical protein ADT71_06720 [Novosphingobium sp. ST904]